MLHRLFFVLFLLLPPLGEVVTAGDSTVRGTSGTEQVFGALPLVFIENRGQIDNQAVAFYVKGKDRTLYFTPAGITFATAERRSDREGRWVLKLDFTGAATVRPLGAAQQKAEVSYFEGTPEEWTTGCPTYDKIIYADLWPGIDLVFKGAKNRLKYEFIVKPGADPDLIRLAYRGATSLTLERTGALEIRTPVGVLEDDKPTAYQVIDGNRKEVLMQYQPGKKTEDGSLPLRFHVGEYQLDESLILDPSLLIYCGFVGGTQRDSATGIAVDSRGCSYITGETYSDEKSFPVTVGPDLVFNDGGRDAYVAKVSPDGKRLDYCGYIGGLNHDYGYAVAIDEHGNAYIAGKTLCDETTFPVLGGPDLTFNGEEDALVAKVPPYHILLRAGNVNTVIADNVDVLFVNGGAGEDAYRSITNPSGTPVTVEMTCPPGGPTTAAFALYVWPGEAGPTDIAAQPYDIGTACFPMPLSSGSPVPPPLTLANNMGYPALLGIPVLPATTLSPSYIIKNKLLNPGTWTLQGIIDDNSASGGSVSLTNAIVLIQQ